MQGECSESAGGVLRECSRGVQKVCVGCRQKRLPKTFEMSGAPIYQYLKLSPNISKVPKEKLSRLLLDAKLDRVSKQS